MSKNREAFRVAREEAVSGVHSFAHPAITARAMYQIIRVHARGLSVVGVFVIGTPKRDATCLHQLQCHLGAKTKKTATVSLLWVEALGLALETGTRVCSVCLPLLSQVLWGVRRYGWSYLEGEGFSELVRKEDGYWLPAGWIGGTWNRELVACPS